MTRDAALPVEATVAVGLHVCSIFFRPGFLRLTDLSSRVIPSSAAAACTVLSQTASFFQCSSDRLSLSLRPFPYST